VQLLGVYFAKLAIFILYLEIFRVRKGMRVAIGIGIGAMTLIYVPFLVAVTYLCAPSDNDQLLKECSELFAYNAFEAAAVIALDIYIFILPLRVAFQSMFKKLIIVAVFMTAAA
jgi:hypothetical protein